jgi:hypothetical protein
MGRKSGGWFKHYNDSHEGDTMRLLLSQGDYGAIALMWIIMELLGQKRARHGSETDTGEIVTTLQILSRASHMQMAKVRRKLEKMSKISFLRFSEVSEGFFEIYVPKWLELQETRGKKRGNKREKTSGRTKELKNIRNKEIKKSNSLPSVAEFDFDLVYENYPRKMGKKKGIEKLRRSVKTQEEHTLLLTAVENYKNYVQAQRIEPQFMKHFDTFTNCWQDFINPVDGVAGEPPEFIKGNPFGDE